MGGLGNQLFQIFTTLAYAIKSGRVYNFSGVETLGSGSTTIRHTYWSSFLKELKPFTTSKIKEVAVIREKSFEYNDIPVVDIKAHDNVMLYGYFQSFKYFQQEFTSICNLIKLNEMKRQVLQKFGPNKDHLASSISLHFRMGDYKKAQQCHPIMKYIYYEKAISYILHNSVKLERVLYFCEDDDLDDVNEIVNELQNRFPNLLFSRCLSTLEDWEQMLVMSACKHNIIANSSFSWWGAYLNENGNKIVCYPSTWFGPALKHNTIDLFPNNWNKIKC
jgi:hypothetical protein